jgi:ParB family transcriptional regulator, chromosome partitioning protein
MTQEKPITQLTGIVDIQLKELLRSDRNVRTTSTNSVAELAASIRAHGLLQNLTVVAQFKKGKPTGKYTIVAGARRHAALLELVKEKVITTKYLVPCLIVDEAAALETSLAENVVREEMHPADQFAAFKAMIDEGAGLEDVAARFGLTVKAVQQRLKLANVSPRLIALYRQGGVNLSQLMALAISDDQAAQERVWDSATQGWQREPGKLREALTESKVDAATDPRALFVGVETYTAAGGQIERDLFHEDHEGYMTDRELLDRLAQEKLMALSEQVKAEGWKWVEIAPTSDYSELSKYVKIYPVSTPLPAELQRELDDLEAEEKALREAHQGADEYPEGVEARLLEIEERVGELRDAHLAFRPEEQVLAGAIVSIGYGGKPDIHRGLVRREDKKQLEAAKSGEGSGNADTITSEQSQGSDLSALLVEDLTTHKTAALRAELVSRPNIALVAVTHNLAVQLCYEARAYDLPTAVSITVVQDVIHLYKHAKGIELSPAQKALDEKREYWRSVLPENPEELWGWLIQRDVAVVLDLLAFCAAQTVYAVRLPHESLRSRLAAAAELASAVSLDMAKWWKPTGDAYFGRVKREQIIAALTDAAATPEEIEALKTKKKAELVEEAEKRLANTNWLPEILRR